MPTLARRQHRKRTGMEKPRSQASGSEDLTTHTSVACITHRHDTGTKTTSRFSFLIGKMRKKVGSFYLLPEETIKNKSTSPWQIQWGIFTAKLKSASMRAAALLRQRCSPFFVIQDFRLDRQVCSQAGYNTCGDCTGMCFSGLLSQWTSLVCRKTLDFC